MNRLIRATAPLAMAAVLAGSGCADSDTAQLEDDVRALEIATASDVCENVTPNSETLSVNVSNITYACVAVGSTVEVSFAVRDELLGDHPPITGSECTTTLEEGFNDDEFCHSGVITARDGFDFVDVVDEAEEAAALNS